ncbi:MAG: DUF393 domain-containing protein [Phycisphaeraceae bacterium]|nr:DUF393 domain-containing protein [Phycisphaeraceae bacterium]
MNERHPADSNQARAQPAERAARAAPAEESSSAPLLLYDGGCALCHRAVRFVVRRDRRHTFRFASLHSRAAAIAIAAAGLRDPLPESMVLVTGGQALVRSDALFAILRELGAPWSMLSILRVLPRALRDWAYDLVARRRQRWFGAADHCALPAPELRARFLDADEVEGATLERTVR